MKKILVLVLMVSACGQVNPDTYKSGQNPTYGRSDGWYFDSNYNMNLIVNGTSVYTIAADGSGATLENGATILNDVDGEIQLADASEDISFGFGTSNTAIMSSDTGVIVLDLGDVGTTLQLANDQTIVSDTNNEIQFGDGGEDISMGFGTANECVLSSDTGVVALDFADVLPKSTATGSLGWAIVAGANTACNTTCVHACVFGFDDGAADAEMIVACDDATADRCLCAGPT